MQLAITNPVVPRVCQKEKEFREPRGGREERRRKKKGLKLDEKDPKKKKGGESKDEKECTHPVIMDGDLLPVGNRKYQSYD